MACKIFFSGLSYRGMKTDSEIIDACGGTTSVAKLCDLTTGAISQWRTNGIPKPWRKFLAEKFPCIVEDHTRCPPNEAA